MRLDSLPLLKFILNDAECTPSVRNFRLIFCVKAVENSFLCASTHTHTHTHVRRDGGVSCGDDLRQSASQRDSSEWYVGPGLHNVRWTSCVRIYILELWRSRRQTVCSYSVAVFFSPVCFEILLYIPLKLPKLRTWRLLACFGYVAAVYVRLEDAVVWACDADVIRKLRTFLW